MREGLLKLFPRLQEVRVWGGAFDITAAYASAHDLSGAA